jgi:HEAT repeat protein
MGKEQPGSIVGIVVVQNVKSVTNTRPIFLRALGDVDEDARETIAWALKHQGNQVLRVLLERRKDTAPTVREHVWTTLHKFDPSDITHAVAREIAVGCCESLNDPNQQVRIAAAFAASQWIPIREESDATPNSFFQAMNKVVGFISHPSRKDIDAITDLAIQRLADMCLAPHAEERIQALHALRWIREGQEERYDASVCSAVFKNLEHEDAGVRSHACDLVPFLSLEPQRMVSMLVPMVDDSSCEVASAASKALLDLAEKGTYLSSAVPALCRLLTRRECDRCDAVYLPFENCCKILLLFPREIAKPAVPLLESSLSSESGQIVSSAAEAIARIDRQVDKAFPRLKELLESGEIHPETFCDVIYRIGPAAASFTNEIVQLLAGPDWDTQWAAADALGSIASTDPVCILALINALSHPSGIVRSAVVRSLGQLGDASVPYLIRVLREGDDEEKEWAADALGVIRRS